MAEVLSKWPGNAFSNRGSYDRYTDGQVWCVHLSDHGAVNLVNLRSAITMVARKKGLYIRTKVDSHAKTVTVQAYSKNVQP